MMEVHWTIRRVVVGHGICGPGCLEVVMTDDADDLDHGPKFWEVWTA